MSRTLARYALQVWLAVLVAGWILVVAAAVRGNVHALIAGLITMAFAVRHIFREARR